MNQKGQSVMETLICLGVALVLVFGTLKFLQHTLKNLKHQKVPVKETNINISKILKSAGIHTDITQKSISKLFDHGWELDTKLKLGSQSLFFLKKGNQKMVVSNNLGLIL